MNAAALDQLQINLDPLGQIGVAVAIMLIMFSVALGLRVSDFFVLRDKPQLFIGGAATQILGLPLLTFIIINTVELPASIALGMIVVACCPGGSVSNLMTYLSRGNVAYSVSLTATSSILAAILTPASILFWSHLYAPTSRLLDAVEVSPALFLIQTTVILIVPLALGMVVGAKAPDVADRIRRRTALIGALFLGGVIAYGAFYFFPTLYLALPFLLVVAAGHNATAFLLGATVAVLLGADRPVRRALTFEVGIQNSGLAVVILVGQLKGLGGAAAIAVTWGVWHLVAGGFIVLLLREIDRRKGRL